MTCFALPDSDTSVPERLFRTARRTTHLLSTATAVLGLVGLLTVFSAQEVNISYTGAEWLEERSWIIELTCRSG